MKRPLRAGGSLPFRPSLFLASSPFTLFDYFRVPYEEIAGPSDGRQGIATLSVRGETRKLSWPTAEALARSQAPASYLIGSIPIFGPVATDAQMLSWLGSRRPDWHAAHEVRDERGMLAGTILQPDDGSTFLPFNPNGLIANYWEERYVDDLRPAATGLLASLAQRGYYRSRPFLPRSMQMSMRRSFSRIQSKARFPRWPVETALHDLYDLLFALLAAVSERPIPYIGQWPRNWSWALVLTHDVETQVGYDRLPELLQIERRRLPVLLELRPTQPILVPRTPHRSNPNREGLARGCPTCSETSSSFRSRSCRITRSSIYSVTATQTCGSRRRASYGIVAASRSS